MLVFHYREKDNYSPTGWSAKKLIFDDRDYKGVARH